MSTTAEQQPTAAEAEAHGRIWGVIAASSTGTIIEWYDFYIFGALASTISQVFYPETNATISLLKWLATFAVGFAVRPFGALVFGRVGDMVGRKYAFMLTLLSWAARPRRSGCFRATGASGSSRRSSSSRCACSRGSR
jgi:MFS family permease